MAAEILPSPLLAIYAVVFGAFVCGFLAMVGKPRRGVAFAVFLLAGAAIGVLLLGYTWADNPASKLIELGPMPPEMLQPAYPFFLPFFLLGVLAGRFRKKKKAS